MAASALILSEVETVSGVRIPKRENAVKAKSRTNVVVTVVPEEEEYTDEQFYADVAKCRDKLEDMAKAALEEHAQGKTRKFPA